MSLLATPLDFVFKGYSIWLELEQVESDLDLAVDAAAVDLHVHAIPAPHVTVIYGISHLSEDECLKRFSADLATRLKAWPDLRAMGLKVDISFDGVDGQEMDMAWMEVEFETSEAHECLCDAVHGTFYDGSSPRPRPWAPHFSIAYENPSIAKVNLPFARDFMERFPTLTSQKTRKVKAISLWRTKGRMEDWKCLHRFALQEAAASV